MRLPPWIRRLLGGRPHEPDHEVQAAQDEQQAHFDEWGTVLAEVRRVEKMSAGGRRRSAGRRT